jgi:uncharacterized membrane protein YphA (DoxX/SURF4 family)
VAKLLDKPDFGKMVIRVTLGLIFAWCGVNGIGGGRSPLFVFNYPFSLFSFTLNPRVWILAIAVVYLVAGILFMAGSFFKSCCVVLTIVEVLQVRQIFLCGRPNAADSFVLHVVLAAVCFGFLYISPGRYSASS